MYAQVIVDVPHVETDKPFDYHIPSELRPHLTIGSRVSAPFGNRKIQGYVVGLSETTSVKKARDLEDVLDVVPPLTPELIELGEWMSERYLCRRYVSFQAMLPAALRSSYKKSLSLTEDGKQITLLIPQERQLMRFIEEKQPIDYDQLLKNFPGEKSFLLKALREGWLQAEQVVKDKVTRKTLLYVIKAESDQTLQQAAEALPKQASKQREILQFMLDLQHPIALRDLLAQLSASQSSAQALVSKGLLKMEEVEERRDPYAGRAFEQEAKVVFTPEQREVIDEIVFALNRPQPFSYLLRGVTGSGKTEVYLETIEHCLQMDRQAIVLVPEISLTPQMVNRFKAKFGDQVAVLHSGLSRGERYDEWRMIREGKVNVAVGARSAIFAPFTKLGLIIIDEEHEGSYKQEENPRYHAREVAKKRAELHGAVTVFGSATPALESYYEATKTETGLLEMPYRVNRRPMPSVSVVDMRDELKQGNRSMFSRLLAQGIETRLSRGEQMVLFLNRRGFSTFVMCRSCGHSLQCPHCDISLTYHRSNQTVRCHYCGHTERDASECPDCGSKHIRYFGTGTQKVEEELSRHFPGIRVIRMDVDTTGRKGSHEKWLTQFREGKGEVLLGTQMIAKGLDFPKVTLVGVIAADTILGMPDFRAAERTFQLLTQVGGRAGRHELPGEVIIQSYNPDHYSIQLAKNHDFEKFFAMEMKHRYEQNYPPFYRLVLFTFSSPDVPLVVKKADEWVKQLKRKLPSSVYLLGPVASPIPRIKDRYRFQCMIKYRDEADILSQIKLLSDSFIYANRNEDIGLTIDVDPHMLM
ncbi:primosomal protein N' [Ammoniphilus oxalaticus]|uniref:Replication restart protein PriA n=1 Tax=Ammoniphilus oxalaticus TaxID=66863 RepID=A0A419SJD0_9BACL|nr:primosomal protein N' [Ammoniphilus oxalaticus]RKD24141.1 primosomal protein N' [Ammoniphilus oxalaticus]